MPRLLTLTVTITLGPEEAAHPAPCPDAAPGPAPGSRPEQDGDTPAPRRMPWDKPVPPEIAACPLCDRHGFVEVWDAQGTLVLLHCPHDTVRLRAAAACHGYQLVREDRSREPPLPAAEGGPEG